MKELTRGSHYVSERVKKLLTRWKRECYRLAHFNSTHGTKKSITYCNVGNEILRLIRHSSLACHGREGHRGEEEETRQGHKWVDISLTSKVSSQGFPARPRGFPVTNVSVGKGITRRERDGRKRYLVARLAVRARREIAEAIHELSLDIEQLNRRIKRLADSNNGV